VLSGNLEALLPKFPAWRDKTLDLPAIFSGRATLPTSTIMTRLASESKNNIFPTIR
jgi:hypothetical protein